MKALISVMMACVIMTGCSAEKFPILHPEKQKDTAKDYPCGIHADPYKVARNGKVVQVCCPDGYHPSNMSGYCVPQ